MAKERSSKNLAEEGHTCSEVKFVTFFKLYLLIAGPGLKLVGLMRNV